MSPLIYWRNLVGKQKHYQKWLGNLDCLPIDLFVILHTQLGYMGTVLGVGHSHCHAPDGASGFVCCFIHREFELIIWRRTPMARVMHGFLDTLNCAVLSIQRRTSASRRNEDQRRRSHNSRFASEPLESRVLLTSSPGPVAVVSPISITGTTGSDLFSVSYSTTTPVTATVKISSNGSTPKLVGTYSAGVPLSIAGLFGNDAVKLIGTSGKEQFAVSGGSIKTNTATVTINSVENIELAGGGNDDIYSIDADTALPRIFIDEAGGGVDTLDFSLTTMQGVNVNLGSSILQAVNINLGLQLRNPSALENVIGSSRDDGLIGNANANFLVGGPGNDLLDGQAGNDLLIGGLGYDQLSGGLNDDIVIAGRTTYDGNISALRDLIAEWKSTASYTTRVARLRSGVGGSKALLVAKSTVLHDSFVVDIIRGDAGQDWFFRGVEERAIDQAFGEISDML